MSFSMHEWFYNRSWNDWAFLAWKVTLIDMFDYQCYLVMALTPECTQKKCFRAFFTRTMWNQVSLDQLVHLLKLGSLGYVWFTRLLENQGSKELVTPFNVETDTVPLDPSEPWFQGIHWNWSLFYWFPESPVSLRAQVKLATCTFYVLPCSHWPAIDLSYL